MWGCGVVNFELYIPRPESPAPALLETPTRFFTSLRFAKAPSNVSIRPCQRVHSHPHGCVKAYQEYQRVQSLRARSAQLSVVTDLKNVPPHSNVSPDFTSLTASSTESHILDVLGTGKSVGMLYFLRVPTSDTRSVETEASLAVEYAWATNMMVGGKDRVKLRRDAEGALGIPCQSSFGRGIFRRRSLRRRDDVGVCLEIANSLF